MNELELHQRQHEEIIRQMRIDTMFNGIMAVASLVTMFVIASRVIKS